MDSVDEKANEFMEKATRKPSGSNIVGSRFNNQPRPPLRKEKDIIIRMRKLERDKRQFKEIGPMIAKMEKDLKFRAMPAPSRYHSLPIEAQSDGSETASSSAQPSGSAAPGTCLSALAKEHSELTPVIASIDPFQLTARESFHEDFIKRIRPKADNYYMTAAASETATKCAVSTPRDINLHGRRMSRVALNDKKVRVDYKFGNVLWLNLQMYLHGMPMKGDKQIKKSTNIFDGTLLKKQQEMQIVLRNIRDVRFGSDELEETSIDLKIGDEVDDAMPLPVLSLTTDYLDQWAVMYHQVAHLLHDFEELRALYPNHETMVIMQRNKHQNELCENRLNCLYLWFNQSSAIARRLYDLGVMIGVDPNDDSIMWPFLTVHNFEDISQSLQWDEEANDSDNEDIDPDTSNGRPASGTLSPDISPSTFRTRTLSTFPKSSYVDLYAAFVHKSMCHKGVRHELKRLHRMTAPILLKVQHSLRRTAQRQGLSPRVSPSVTSGAAASHQPLSATASRPIPLTPRSTHIQNFMPKNMDFFAEMQCGESNPEFERMNLLSLRPMALFMLRITLDVVHQWIRYRLNEKSSEKPDALSLDSLISECHDCLRAAVEVKTYYQEFVQSTTVNDQALTTLLIDNLHEFESDLRKMFELYLSYVSSWINIQTTQVQDTTTEWWQELTKKLETEWRFAKRTAISVVRGEFEAAKMFCNFGESMFKQMSGEHLKQAYQHVNRELYEDEDMLLEESDSELGLGRHVDYDTDAADPDNSNNSLTNSKCSRQHSVVLSMCRETKKIIRDVRERSLRALGFAKLLTNDMEIAARFQLGTATSTRQLMDKLLAHDYVMVTAHTSGVTTEAAYAMFCESAISTDMEHLLLLLNVTCGRDKHEVPKHLANKETYLLLVECEPAEVNAWQGQRVHVNPDPDTQMSLQYMQIDGVYLVVVNSRHLPSQCAHMVRRLAESLQLVQEQCSCHELVADQMDNLKDMACYLRSLITEHIEQMTGDLLDGQDFASLSATERNSYRDTLIHAYNFVFEYVRELTRFAPSRREELSHELCRLMVNFTQFVRSKFQRGHKSFPKWAQPSFGFMTHVSLPLFTLYLNDDEFAQLRQSLFDCVDHIIGDANSGSLDTALRKTSLQLQVNGVEPQSSSLEDDDEGLDILVDRRTTISNAVQNLDEKLQTELQKNRLVGREIDVKSVRPKQHFHGKRAPFKWQRMEKKIGEGRFGKVYPVLNLNSNQMLAMKEIRKTAFHRSEGDMAILIDEYKTFEGVSHPNLVKFHGIEEHTDRILIFMEYCTEGTLEKVCLQGLDRRTYREYTYLLLKGVQYLHHANIIHRDIKPANIFLCSGPERLKLGDFGCSTRLADSGTVIGQLTGMFGSPLYMAPEVLRNGRSLTTKETVGYGRAADVWSIGCTVLEMISGKPPWHEYDSNNFGMIVLTVGEGKHPPLPVRLDGSDRQFLECCFTPDDRQRWTVDQMLNHSFCRVMARQDSVAGGRCEAASF